MWPLCGAGRQGEREWGGVVGGREGMCQGERFLLDLLPPKMHIVFLCLSIEKQVRCTDMKHYIFADNYVHTRIRPIQIHTAKSSQQVPNYFINLLYRFTFHICTHLHTQSHTNIHFLIYRCPMPYTHIPWSPLPAQSNPQPL